MHLLIIVLAFCACIGFGSICNVNDLPNVITKENITAYDSARHQWASLMGSIEESDYVLSPRVITFCENEDDVITVVNFASACGFKISIRSGGHQYGGFSSCSADREDKCIQLDVSRLEVFEYHGGNIVTLGVGLTITQVLEHLLPLGLTIPMGICKSVGVGGHFQSSSQGFLGRSFGLGMDHVTSFRMVMADGTLQTITQESNPSLYWAVLGGSPGSWGVILSYTVEAIVVSDVPNTHLLQYTFPYSHELFVEMGKHWLESFSNETTARDIFNFFFVSPAPRAPNVGFFNHYITFIILWTGVDNGPLTAEIMEEHIEPLLNFGVDPLPGSFSLPLPLNVIASNLQFDFDHSPFRYHVHSMSMNDIFDENFLEMTATELDFRMQIPGVYSSFQIQPYGALGVGSQVNRNTGINSYPVRDITVHVDDWVFFSDEAQSEMIEARINQFRRKTKRYWRMPGSASNSFMTTDTSQDEKEKLKDYYPTPHWLKKLIDIKTLVDPNNIFESQMTIPTRN